jgi:tetratricopeptide (TPR) repeat protein
VNFVAGVLIQLAALAAVAAPGTDLQRRALVLYQEGVELYGKGDYEGAVRAFRAADGLAPSPEYIFNIAQSYRHLGDCPKALATYREYVRLRPQATGQKGVVEGLAEMQACARPLPAVDATPPAQDLSAPMPAAEPSVETPPLAPRPSGVVSASPPNRLLQGSIAVAAAGVVAAGVGAGLWGSAAGDYNHLQASCGTACSPAAVIGPQNKLFAGYGLVAAGAALTGTGLAFLLFDRWGEPGGSFRLAGGPGGIVVAGTLGP